MRRAILAFEATEGGAGVLGRLTNDVLIAVSAARCGIAVVTANGRDFEKLAEFCSLDWQLN